MNDNITNILEMDLTSVDDSFPLIKDKTLVDLEVVSMTVRPTKDNPDRSVLEVVYRTCGPTVGTKGQTVNSGFPIYDRIGITPSEKVDSDSIARRLKVLRKGLTSDASGQFAPLSQYIGKVALAELGVQIDKTGQFSDKNVIRKFVPRA